MAKHYEIIRGTEREGVRYEPGDVVDSYQLRGWGIDALLAKGAIREVDERQMGSPIRAGTRYIVGGNGPEIFVPNTGRVIDDGDRENESEIL